MEIGEVNFSSGFVTNIQVALVRRRNNNRCRHTAFNNITSPDVTLVSLVGCTVCYSSADNSSGRSTHVGNTGIARCNRDRSGDTALYRITHPSETEISLICSTVDDSVANNSSGGVTIVDGAGSRGRYSNRGRDTTIDRITNNGLTEVSLVGCAVGYNMVHSSSGSIARVLLAGVRGRYRNRG